MRYVVSKTYCGNEVEYIMNYLYHGSSVHGITELKPCSKLHNADKRVIYLTDNVPYALLYIWDSNVIGYDCKHVTGWIKNGLVYYEEQFPDQLKMFYQGAKGYLYYIESNADFCPVEDRECMFYSLINAKICKLEFVQDVYGELIKYEKLGKIKILRYNEQTLQRQEELNNMILTAIIRSNFYENSEARRGFYKKYFAEVWKKALETASSRQL